MKHIERRGTYSVKVDGLQKYYGSDDLVPLWVADMDFKTPDCVRDALQEVLDGGVYGYNLIPDNYFPTIARWLAQKQKWSSPKKQKEQRNLPPPTRSIRC